MKKDFFLPPLLPESNKSLDQKDKIFLHLEIPLNIFWSVRYTLGWTKCAYIRLILLSVPQAGTGWSWSPGNVSLSNDKPTENYHWTLQCHFDLQNVLASFSYFGFMAFSVHVLINFHSSNQPLFPAEASSCFWLNSSKNQLNTSCPAPADTISQLLNIVWSSRVRYFPEERVEKTEHVAWLLDLLMLFIVSWMFADILATADNTFQPNTQNECCVC